MHFVIIIVSYLALIRLIFVELGFPQIKRKYIQYNTSARHERHECDTSATGATRVLHERHECNTSATRTTRVR